MISAAVNFLCRCGRKHVALNISGKYNGYRGSSPLEVSLTGEQKQEWCAENSWFSAMLDLRQTVHAENEHA
jgi:hypothetical protein